MKNSKNNKNQKDAKTKAKKLFWLGWRISDISKELKIKAATLHSWKSREDWQRASTIDTIKASLEDDILRLISLPNRTKADEARIASNFKYLEHAEKIKKYKSEKSATDKMLNTKLSRRGRKTNQQNNELSEENISDLKSWFDKTFLKWGYQRKWHKAKSLYPIRNILKSRQIGATYYFAHEAFLDALETGDNQIFLSATKNQAKIFLEYIKLTVSEVCNIELKGSDRIKLSNGATLYAMATNKSSAQGYHGHYYLDEYFWIHGFAEFQRVSSGMAMHKKWRETYFSTPSSLEHEAYPFWSGDHFNKDRPKAEHIKVDISHKLLRGGNICDDGQWRNMITIEDAIDDGCDLFDIDSLRRKYPGPTFDNLLMCEFINSASSAFSFTALQKCMVESYQWDNYHPMTKRPYGNLPVWCGYDPARTGDDASFVVIAPPMVSGGKFRLLERYNWQGKDFEYQAREIFKILKRFNVEYLGIDVSGMGYGVFELIKKKYINATPIIYSIESKNRMILKAQNIISHCRFEFDFIESDVISSFTGIRRTIKSGQVTYEAGRTAETGHSDLAWAIMHALDNEPLSAVIDDEIDSTGKSFVEFSN